MDTFKQEAENGISDSQILHAREKHELSELHQAEINNLHNQISIFKTKAGDANVTGGAGGGNGGDGGSVTIIGGSVIGGNASPNA